MKSVTGVPTPDNADAIHQTRFLHLLISNRLPHIPHSHTRKLGRHADSVAKQVTAKICVFVGGFLT